VWRAIAWTPDELLARASAWRDALALPGVEVIEARSAVGGGTLPGVTLPTFALALPLGDPDGTAARLRACDPPVVARIEGGRVLLDPRTVLPGEDEAVLSAIRAAARGAGG
jgi:L-seryl-tRNA(Ser) seleniumtransferase